MKHDPEDVKAIRSHPQELLWLSTAALCHRFTFKGFGNLLVLYLMQRFSLEFVEASHIYGLFIGLGFGLPVLGGYITDRWNYVTPVYLGLLLTALGSLLLIPSAISFLYIGLALIILGGSLFIPSSYALLGRAYCGKCHLREVGFSCFYVICDFGIFLALTVLGKLIEAHMWHYLFLSCAALQIVGMLCHAKSLTYFPKEKLDPHPPKKQQRKRKPARWERERIILISIICLLAFFFWAPFSQSYSTITYFTENFTDRQYGSFLIPTAWVISSEKFFMTLLVIPFSMLYIFLRSFQKEPTPPTKIILSLFATALCFFCLAYASEHLPPQQEVSPMWVVLASLFLSFGELLFVPISLSFISNLSPKRLVGFFVGLWYLFSGLAFYFGGYAAQLFRQMSMATYFSYYMYTLLGVAIVLLIFVKKLNAMRHLERYQDQQDPSM